MQRLRSVGVVTRTGRSGQRETNFDNEAILEVQELYYESIYEKGVHRICNGTMEISKSLQNG